MFVSSTTQIFKQADFDINGLDDLFKNIAFEIPDGYLVCHGGGETRYLFFIASKLYTSAVLLKEGARLTSIQEFFFWYKAKGKCNVEAYRSDKKLMLCLLVKMAFKPAQQFSTESISLEDVIKKIDETGRDVVMALQDEESWGFTIFLEGKASYVFLPKRSDESEVSPLDQLLVYCYTRGNKTNLNIEIYYDTNVMPATDAADFPEEGVLERYVNSIQSAYCEVIRDGKVIGIYPIVGEVTIGRDPENNIQLLEEGISRGHAVIRELKGRYILEDLKSTNGTVVNGERIEHKELKEGDTISINAFSINIHLPAEEIDVLEEIVGDADTEKENLASQTIYAAVKTKTKADVTAAREAGQIIKGTLVLGDGTEVSLGSITSIGKDKECDIVGEGVMMGKRHAVVIRGKDSFKVVKKSGLGAMKVNDVKKDEHVLRDSDVIVVGNLSMMFRRDK